MARSGKAPRKKRLQQPYIFSNLAVSLDGKIAFTGRGGLRLTGSTDRKMMDRLRAEADAVLVGAATVRADGYAQKVRDKKLRQKRRRQGREPQPLNVCVSRRLNFPLNRPMFQEAGVKCVVFCSSQAPLAERKRVERVADLQVLPGKSFSPANICHHLYRMGVRDLLLEGGGEMVFSFLKARLLQRMYVTLAPIIIGGTEAPTLVGGEGFSPENHPKLRLAASRRVGHELYLAYDVHYGSGHKNL